MFHKKMMPSIREIQIIKTNSKSSPNVKLSKQARHFNEKTNCISETNSRIWYPLSVIGILVSFYRQTLNSNTTTRIVEAGNHETTGANTKSQMSRKLKN